MPHIMGELAALFPLGAELRPNRMGAERLAQRLARERGVVCMTRAAEGVLAVLARS